MTHPSVVAILHKCDVAQVEDRCDGFEDGPLEGRKGEGETPCASVQIAGPGGAGLGKETREAQEEGSVGSER
jgi:hypothetical protein